MFLVQTKPAIIVTVYFPPSGEFCTIPMPPIGGQLGCADWGPGGNFKVCTITCDEGLEFAEKIPRFYTCGVEGFWRPTKNPDKPFIFPACASKILKKNFIFNL